MRPTWERSWLTKTIVSPRRAFRSRTRSSILRLAASSRALVGSSRRSASGSRASARATEARCCCPTESVSGARPHIEGSSPTTSSSWTGSGLLLPARRAPYRSASSTEVPKRAGIWKTIPTLRRSSSGSSEPVGSPSRYTSPEDGSMRRLIARSRVLFPAPEGPTTAVTSPAGTRASTPARISVPPASQRSLRTSILGRCKLEGLPPQVGVEAIVEYVSVPRERPVVGQRELHAADDCVQALGLRASVLLVHKVCVVDD